MTEAPARAIEHEHAVAPAWLRSADESERLSIVLRERISIACNFDSDLIFVAGLNSNRHLSEPPLLGAQ